MEKEKSLQKFTDFDQIKTKKQVREYMDGNPKKIQDLLDYLFSQYNESLHKKQRKEYELENLISEMYEHNNNDDDARVFRNQTYESNHHKITAAIHNSILENRCFPTMSLIEEGTGLSRQTIYKHLNSGLKNDYNKLVMGKIEYMATHALSKLYLIGIQDNNASALKHFIELSGAINRSPPERINSYVQINNVTITQEDIKNLPPKSVEAITKLLSEARNDKRVINIEQTPKGMEYSSSPKD